MNKKLALGLLFILLPASAIPASAQAPPPNTWVQHVVIVVQENRTPDSLFSAYTNIASSGMDIQSTGISCKGHGTISLSSQTFPECYDPRHGHTNGFDAAYDQPNSTFDNACNVPVDYNSPCSPPANPSAAFASNSNHILDPYYNIAQNFGAANYMFATQQGPSFIGHQFLFSGTSAPENFNSDNVYNLFAAENAFLNGATTSYTGCASQPGTTVNDLNSTYSQNLFHPFFPTEGALYTPIPTIQGVTAGYPCYNHTSLADLLDAANPPNGIGWKYYIQSSQELNSIWTAPNALQAICKPNPGQNCSTNGNNLDWNKVDSVMGDVLSDIQKCQLPAVSWVIPDQAWSDHPGTSLTSTFGDGGPSWVAAIVNANGGANTYSCTSTPYWPNTVVFITWDDWGGWVDHVPPYRGATGGYIYPNSGPPPLYSPDGNWFVYGFRVPLLVVSPYTSAGYVSGAIVNGAKDEQPPYVHDFGSILGFVEAAFSLSPYNTPKSGCGIAGAIDPSNGCNYPFADFFAPDGAYECGQAGVNCNEQNPYPLADFFNLTTPRSTFTPILGPKYLPGCFVGTGPTSSPCFGPNFQPGDPDNDGVDTED